MDTCSKNRIFKGIVKWIVCIFKGILKWIFTPKTAFFKGIVKWIVTSNIEFLRE